MEIFYTSERDIWRKWLVEHFETESEIWFVFPMKESGDKALTYNDAVEEALCFGWIDSTIKHIDPTHRAQRFTPRKKGSPYSRPNIERLIWLDEQGLIHPKVRDDVLPIIRAPYIFPSDILDTIKADTLAWENYKKLSEPYKRIPEVRLLTPHSCRHTYVSQMQALGVDLSTIQSIVGHADVSMTQHYLHVQESIRMDAVDRFSKAFPTGHSDPDGPDEPSCKVLKFPNVG